MFNPDGYTKYSYRTHTRQKIIPDDHLDFRRFKCLFSPKNKTLAFDLSLVLVWDFESNNLCISLLP